jgi:hypothetical protein
MFLNLPSSQHMKLALIAFTCCSPTFSGLQAPFSGKCYHGTIFLQFYLDPIPRLFRKMAQLPAEDSMDSLIVSAPSTRPSIASIVTMPSAMVLLILDYIIDVESHWTSQFLWEEFTEISLFRRHMNMVYVKIMSCAMSQSMHLLISI